MDFLKHYSVVKCVKKKKGQKSGKTFIVYKNWGQSVIPEMKPKSSVIF